MEKQATFSAETKALIDHVAAASPLLHTVSQNKPNRIVAVRADGVIVETESSKSSLNGNPLTPAWMIELAWAHLRATGRLEQSYLVANDGLNVKRSAFVMALLAQFPGVSVTLGPACLHYRTSDA